MDAALWSVCDILRRSNCASAVRYVPELTWILFLRVLDARERAEAEAAAAVGAAYTPSLEAPYRWHDWAATPPRTAAASTAPADPIPPGWKRRELTEQGTPGAFFSFVNGTLLPYLRGLKDRPTANERQRVISEILSGVERVRVDTQKNLLDVLDKVDRISDDLDARHYFVLSQVYEGLLLKMGDKNNDGGQFFTPREVIRAVVKVVDPKVGQTVYDPCCGTGGFLAEAYNHLRQQLGADTTRGTWTRSARRRSSAGRRRTSSTRWRWPTWCCTRSTGRTSGTATR